MNVPPPSQFGQPTPGSGGPWGPPQQGWQQAPSPKRGAAKWIFGAIALLAVIAVTVFVTIMVTGKGAGDRSTPPQSDFASANDVGPVTIITEEPTCTKWGPITNLFSERIKNGWDKRDPSQSSTSWTPTQERQFEGVAQAMRDGAAQAEALSRVTPHRVLRELYEQFILFSRAYADSIPTYTANDDYLARVSLNSAYTIDSICAAIAFGAASLASANPPQGPGGAAVGDFDGSSSQPSRVARKGEPGCSDLAAVADDFDAELADWRTVSSDIPSIQWTGEQRSANINAAQTFTNFVPRFIAVGEKLPTQTGRDFLALAGAYFQSYGLLLPDYTPSMGYLANTGFAAVATVKQACLAD